MGGRNAGDTGNADCRRENSGEAFFCDDPHIIDKQWPADIWQAIDQHKAVLGMNEQQAQLALGQVSRPGSGMINNRTVEYDNGRPVTVTFEHRKATKIQ